LRVIKKKKKKKRRYPDRFEAACDVCERVLY